MYSFKLDEDDTTTFPTYIFGIQYGNNSVGTYYGSTKYIAE